MQLSQGLCYKRPWGGGWLHAINRDAEYRLGGSRWSPRAESPPHKYEGQDIHDGEVTKKREVIRISS